MDLERPVVVPPNHNGLFSSSRPPVMDEPVSPATAIMKSKKFKVVAGVGVLAIVGIVAGVTSTSEKSPDIKLESDLDPVTGDKSDSPTTSPSTSPTTSPTNMPTLWPEPTVSPSYSPSSIPTESPETSEPTLSPSFSPSVSPSTSNPTKSPTTDVDTSTDSPTKHPTFWPEPTASPTKRPTLWPEPTASPTKRPTLWPEPTTSPTAINTQTPTKSPTEYDCPVERPTYGRAKMGSYKGLCSSIEGVLQVSEHVTPNTIRIVGELRGLPPNCVGCGIHIHEGYSCKEGTGAHYWHQGAADPWIGKVYNTDANGVAQIDVTASGIESFSRVMGRTITMHGQDKSRIACGEITPEGLGYKVWGATLDTYPGYEDAAKGTVQRYPGYDGPIAVSGTVSMTESDDGFTLSWDLSNLETDTTGGIHIHEGKTCMQATGGHYYQGATDVWIGKNWDSDVSGQAIGSYDYKIVDGVYSFDENVDHAVTIHNNNGDRIGCTTLAYTPNVKGYVAVNFNRPDALTIFGTVDGLEKQEIGAVGGYHVHVGESCDNAGGHFLLGSEDPWAKLGYLVDVDQLENQQKGRTMLYGHVVKGFTKEEIAGKTVVIHDSYGRRIACGKLEGQGDLLSDASVSQTQLLAGMSVSAEASMGPYVGLSNSIGGSLQVQHRELNKIKITGVLEGLPPSCVDCGIHIHEGYSCTAPEGTGKHYWYSTVDDPWVPTKFTSDASGKAVISIEAEGFYSLEDVLGRTITMHGADKSRIACGVIMPPQGPRSGVAEISSYVGVTNDISGTVTVEHCGNHLRVKGTINDADANCAKCGIHIHEGYSCDVATGGHYWYLAGADPWNAEDVFYSTDSNGAGTFEFDVWGFDSFTRVAGRTFTVHGSNNGRIGCGKIIPNDSPDNYLIAQLDTYPTLDTDVASGKLQPYIGYVGTPVEGTVSMVELPDAISFSWDMTGLEVSTFGGIHIHTGKTCKTATGGHYFTGPSDPWIPVKWFSDASGAATNTVTLDYATGIIPFDESINHAVTVHNFNGDRVACATLSYTPSVRGFVMVQRDTSDPNVMRIYGTMSGVESEYPYPAIGGYHIHAGTSCDNSMGHKLLADGTDPYKNLKYEVSALQLPGKQRATINGDLVYGERFSNVESNAVVIHNSYGTRIACGILNLINP